MKLRDIADELSVSLNSAQRWTKDIVLTPAQVAANRAGPPPGSTCAPEVVARRVDTWSEVSRRKRLDYQAEGRAYARRRGPLHIAGCILYWAEGTKARNTIRLTNSDPEMHAFFCHFLRESLGVQDHRLRIALNVYTDNGLTIGEIEDHWLGKTGLDRSALRKHQINNRPTSSSGKKRNRLPYGVCSLAVAKSTREIQHIFGAIQEYAGFDEPGWVDGPAG